MNILVPLEAPSTEQLVLPFCRELPGLPDGSISVLRVVSAESPAERIEAEAEAAADLLHAERAFFGLSRQIRVIVRLGDPAREIVAAADEFDVDLVLMHVRAPERRGRPQGPSVTERVLALTHRPVVVIQDESESRRSGLFARVALGIGTRFAKNIGGSFAVTGARPAHW